MFTIKDGVIYTKDSEGNDVVSRKSYNVSECCNICVFSNKDDDTSNLCRLNVMLRPLDVVPVDTINGKIVFKRHGGQLYGLDKVLGKLHLCCDSLAKLSGNSAVVFKYVKKEEEEENK